MPIHFAPSLKTRARSPMARVLRLRHPIRSAANDNATVDLFDAVQQHARALFAAHGVAAVAHFDAAARTSAAAGDRGAAMRYLAYCAAFDSATARRLAAELGTS